MVAVVVMVKIRLESHKIEMIDMPSSCMPTPTEHESSSGSGGGRSTSPCTSFQPDSSWVRVGFGLGLVALDPASFESFQPDAYLQLFLLLYRIVTVEVAPQRAHHDHRDDARQEQHDRERVEDREPVDLIVAHVQVQIPPRRPTDWRRFPRDVVPG